MRKKVGLFFIIFLILTASLYGQSKLETNFNNLADEILSNLQEFYPVKATEMGIHKYNYALTDYSGGSVKKEISALKKFERRLYQYNNTKLSTASKINLKLLKSNVDIALQNLSKIQWHKRNPYLYMEDAVNGIYFLLISEHAPLSQRVQNINSRMKLVPDLLRQARSNIKKSPPVYIKLAREMIVTAKDFYNSVASEMTNKFPELAAEITMSSKRAIEAMEEYDQFLAELTPDDESSFAIGKDDFNYILEHEYFFDFDSDSLLKIGETLYSEADSAYNAYMAWLDSNDTIDSVYVLNCIEKQDVLDYYQWEVDQGKLFIKLNDIVTVPENIGYCKVIETPDFMTNIIGSYAYQMPGPFNSYQEGQFYVRPISDSLDEGQKNALYRYIQRRGLRTLVTHEAYPGHHFQTQMASRNESDVRKWQMDLSYIEGWALYSEEMMYDCGLYGENKRAYSYVLWGVLFRAARIVLDVKLHTGQISREDAANWLMEAISCSAEMANAEINRYTMNPTNQMSYLMGKREIIRLRGDLKAQEGDSFSLKSFHDRLLAEGSIPIPLIREEWGLGK